MADKPQKSTIPKATIDEVEVRIRSSIKNPNVGKVETIRLKDGPEVFKIATAMQILNKDKTHHHWDVKIYHGRLRGPALQHDRCATLDETEALRLKMFLTHLFDDESQRADGDYALVDKNRLDVLGELETFLQTGSPEDRVRYLRLMAQTFEATSVDKEQLELAFGSSQAHAVRALGAGARFVSYGKILDQLGSMISDGSYKESDYQRILSENPWLFGSEYSELLSRRNWTRDEQLDFMLRRTADGYVEVVEIKTPISEPLFRMDGSHKTLVPSSNLSGVIGQVINYMSKIERNRDSIIATDNLDPMKIRARIIIGRDNNDKQVAALRELNHHLHGIEVLTFDQLLRIGNRVVSIFEAEATSEPLENNLPLPANDDDIPF
jgi:hypothetical protein